MTKLSRSLIPLGRERAGFGSILTKRARQPQASLVRGLVNSYCTYLLHRRKFCVTLPPLQIAQVACSCFSWEMHALLGFP